MLKVTVIVRSAARERPCHDSPEVTIFVHFGRRCVVDSYIEEKSVAEGAQLGYAGS
jgi:hypothetical protein